jgi:hypothetical protein
MVSFLQKKAKGRAAATLASTAQPFVELWSDEYECVTFFDVLEDDLLLVSIKHLENVLQLSVEHPDVHDGAWNVGVPGFERLVIDPTHVLRSAVERLAGPVDVVIVSVHDESFLS